MKVLHIDEQRQWGGGERQASWLIEGLAARGHGVLVAGRRGGPFVASDHGGANPERVALPFLGEWDLWTAWRLAGVVRRASVDILHAHTSHAHTMACLAGLWAGRAKVVVSRRVSYAPRTHGLSRPGTHGPNRWKYSRPDVFLAVSQRVAEVLRDSGVAGGRVEVVCSAIDLARLDVAPLPRGELGIPEGVPLLVTAGSLVWMKDHASLLRAMPAVLDAFPGTRLVVAGEGKLRGRLDALVAGLGLGESVRMVGHREDAPRLIRAADVYVSSSSSGEGLGTSVLEALACETPVVATAAGGIPEMVVDGETGRLVPSGDPEVLAAAIVSTLRNRDAALAMARRGRTLVEERYLVDRMVEETIEVYERLLADGEGR